MDDAEKVREFRERRGRKIREQRNANSEINLRFPEVDFESKTSESTTSESSKWRRKQMPKNRSMKEIAKNELDLKTKNVPERHNKTARNCIGLE